MLYFSEKGRNTRMPKTTTRQDKTTIQDTKIILVLWYTSLIFSCLLVSCDRLVLFWLVTPPRPHICVRSEYSVRSSYTLPSNTPLDVSVLPVIDHSCALSDCRLRFPLLASCPSLNTSNWIHTNMAVCLLCHTKLLRVFSFQTRTAKNGTSQSQLNLSTQNKSWELF